MLLSILSYEVILSSCWFESQIQAVAYNHKLIVMNFQIQKVCRLQLGQRHQSLRSQIWRSKSISNGYSWHSQAGTSASNLQHLIVIIHVNEFQSVFYKRDWQQQNLHKYIVHRHFFTYCVHKMHLHFLIAINGRISNSQAVTRPRSTLWRHLYVSMTAITPPVSFWG